MYSPLLYIKKECAITQEMWVSILAYFCLLSPLMKSVSFLSTNAPLMCPFLEPSLIVTSYHRPLTFFPLS